MNLVVQEKMDIASSNSREKETQTCRIYMEEGVCEQVIYILVAREGFVMFMLHSSYSQNLPCFSNLGSLANKKSSSLCSRAFQSPCLHASIMTTFSVLLLLLFFFSFLLFFFFFYDYGYDVAQGGSTFNERIFYFPQICVRAQCFDTTVLHAYDSLMIKHALYFVINVQI